MQTLVVALTATWATRLCRFESAKMDCRWIPQANQANRIPAAVPSRLHRMPNRTEHIKVPNLAQACFRAEVGRHRSE